MSIGRMKILGGVAVAVAAVWGVGALDRDDDLSPAPADPTPSSSPSESSSPEPPPWKQPRRSDAGGDGTAKQKGRGGDDDGHAHEGEAPWDPGATAADGGWALTNEGRAGWEPVVTRFARAFLASERPPERWLSALEPLVWKDLYADMQTIDPQLVPPGEPGPITVEESGDAMVDATVTVNGPDSDWLLGVRMQYMPAEERWIVYRYEDRGTAKDGGA